MIQLTRKQFAIFEFIKSEIRTKHRPPTFEEIAEKFDYRSNNAANDHVKALERKGLLKRQPGAARGITVIDQPIKVAA